LPVGFIGLMLVGMLGGKLATLGAGSIITSALTVKNIYEPLFPGKSERHYMIVARLTIPILLMLAIMVALYLNSGIALLKTLISLSVIWGAPILLIFLWRRLTQISVVVEVIACFLIIGILPMIIPTIPALSQCRQLTVMTHEKFVPIRIQAGSDDVKAGRALKSGEWIVRQHPIEPVSVFFEEGVAPIDSEDSNSPKEGIGRFNTEIFLVSLLGFKVTNWMPAQLLATRYLVDCLLPFFILFTVSSVTKPTETDRVARFYVRMKTPVAATLEADARAVEESYANPTRFDHLKLFPGSNWEHTKWNKTDVLGFLACCGLVIFILIFFEAMLALGS
jgi:hypothetical protein